MNARLASRCKGLVGYQLTPLSSLVYSPIRNLAIFSIRPLSACLQNRYHLDRIHLSSSTLARKLSTNLDDFPKPFVAKDYSYAFGRSKNRLEYTTIGRLLDEYAREEPDKTMLIVHHEGIKKTVAEFNADVNRMANCLYQNVNIRRGDVVGIWSCNNYNWVVIQYAVVRLGAILCTVNPYYKVAELEHVLRMGDVKALFLPGHGSKQEIVNNFIPELTAVLSKEDKPGMHPLLLKHVITLDGSPLNKEDFPSNRDVQLHTLAKLDGCSAEFDPALANQVLPDDPALILFTSGTTGKPKGACIGHFSMANDTRFIYSKVLHDPCKELACNPLPLFHAFAGGIGTIGMVSARIPMLIPYIKHNPQLLVDAMIEHKSTLLMGTPTLVIDALRHIQKANTQVPSLRAVFTGGASMPPDIARQFLDTIESCNDFHIIYGSTESGPVSTITNLSLTIEQRTETVGTPIDFVEVKVVDKETKYPVKLCEIGEVHIRGFCLMKGYWKEAEKTRECIDEDGWYNTGDQGSMDENGLLKIHGRTKELIIVGGENVHPLEVEELLRTHPDIADASIVGVPDPRRGEVICAWIKLANPESKLSQEELKQFCKDNITYFKVPTYFLFVKKFPHTSTGKPQKFKMREISIAKLNLKK